MKKLLAIFFLFSFYLPAQAGFFLFSPSPAFAQSCTPGGHCEPMRTGCGVGEIEIGELNCGSGRVCCTSTCHPIGHCEPIRTGCGTGEEEAGEINCGSGRVCCVAIPTPTPPGTPAPTPPPSQPSDCPEGKTYVAIFRTCLDFGEFAGALINWLMIIAAGLAIIKVAAGGIQYIFASGDPKNLENAHATMTSAIVGLMLVLLAWVIMKLIGELTPESWQIRLLGG